MSTLRWPGSTVRTVDSGSGYVTYTGIADDHGQPGWGLRTLSSAHPRFDPLAYQQGSIWPFDTSLIVSGLRRYGQDEVALGLTRATTDAAAAFRLHRLPEFIAGTQRQPGDAPTHTPRADRMQAWSAAALPLMTTELLGLEVDGFACRVTVRRPLLPAGVHHLRIADLRAERIGLTWVSVRDVQPAEARIEDLVIARYRLHTRISALPAPRSQARYPRADTDGSAARRMPQHCHRRHHAAPSATVIAQTSAAAT